METFQLHTMVEKDGEILIRGLPYRQGQTVDMIVLVRPADDEGKVTFTARDLLQSELIGIWKDRKDIANSSEFARQLREQAYRHWD